MSGADWPSQMPDRPPLMKSDTTPSAHSMGVFIWMRARHSVASKVKVFTADGTAISIVKAAKAMPMYGLMPEMNMWWPQTTKLRPEIAIIAPTIALWPKIGLRAKVEMMSDVKPRAGSIRM